MKVLIISSYLPYPLFSGGHIRLYNLMKHLSKNHEITLICEKRKHQTNNDIAAVEKICQKVITVPREKQWSIKNIIKTGFSLNPFLITGHTSPQMKQKIKEELSKKKYDLIHAETFYILQNIPQTFIPIVLAEHNIEYLVYKRFADTTEFYIRPFLYLDIEKLKRQEKQAWQKVTKLIAVSEEEKKIMARKDVVVIPNGVDLIEFPFKFPQKKLYHSSAKRITLPEKELLFIGDFKWLQNRDAVKWIIKDIWPFLLRSLNDELKIKLRVVGKNIPSSLRELNSFDSIIFDENAPEKTSMIYESADVLLAPIRAGGGTSYKILEAMASGVPVVTTKRGISGIEAQSGKHALAADDVQTIVDQTSRLLRDDEYYKIIAKNARELIEKKYNWEIIAQKLDEVYKSVNRY